MLKSSIQHSHHCLLVLPHTSLVVLETCPWPQGCSRTPDEGHGLGLG